jgi:hypothetical protein
MRSTPAAPGPPPRSITGSTGPTVAQPAVKPAPPLPYDPSINADAVSGQHAAEPFNLSDAVAWLNNPTHLN